MDQDIHESAKPPVRVPVVLAKILPVLKVAVHPLFASPSTSIRQEILGYEGNGCLPHTLWLDPGNLTGATCG